MAPVRAAVRTWTGTGANANWSTAGNWAPAGAPANGDSLVFPAGAPGLVNTNDLVGRGLESISFNGASGGYALRGNAITLTNGITAANTAGDNDVDMSLTLGANQTFSVATGGTLDVNGNINLNGRDLTLFCSFDTRLDGAISGTGNMVKVSSGTLFLGGPNPNTFAGEVFLNAGTLILAKTAGGAIPGIFYVGDGLGTDVARFSAANQITDNSIVNVRQGGTLDLFGFSDTIGSLVMEGATVATATGTLTLGGMLTNLSSSVGSVISGNLNLGSAATRTIGVANGSPIIDLDVTANVSGTGGFMKTGAGALRWNGTNTYSGTTTVNGGELRVESDFGFGSTSGGTEVTNGFVRLFGANVGAEPLMLRTGNPLIVAGSCSWTGAVTLNATTVEIAVGSGGTFNIAGPIGGPGGLHLPGLGTTIFSGTNDNTYGGPTWLRTGTLLLNKTPVFWAMSSDLIIGDGDTNDTEVVRYLAGAQLPNISITISNSGVLDLNGFSDATGSLILYEGRVTTGLGTLTLNGNVTATGSPPAPFLGARIEGRLNLSAGSHIFNMLSAGDASALEIVATIVGSGGITKTGNGLVTMLSSNSYDGVTSIQDGTIFIGNSFSLGSTNQGTVVENGGSLWLVAGGMTVPESLALNGPGSSLDNGALAMGNPNSGTWSGPIAISTDCVIGVYGPGTLTLSGTIVGPGGFTKNQSGTLRLSGSGDNLYQGTTRVVEGTLELAKEGTAWALGGSASLVVGDNVGGVNVDVVRYLAGGSQLNATVPITIHGSGLLDLNGFNDDIGDVFFFGGDLQTGTGIAILSGDVLVNNSTNTSAIISGILLCSGTRTFTVSNSPAFPADVTVSAEIRGAGGLTKLGLGTMELTSSNGYSGLTTVSAGRLEILNSFALGGTASGTTVASNANLTLRGGIHIGLEPLTLNGDGAVTGIGGALASGLGSNSWAGAITLATDSVIYVDSGDSLNLTGAIGGPGQLQFFGHASAGPLILSGAGANTYSGGTVVFQGLMLLDKAAANGAIPGDLQIGTTPSGATVVTRGPLGVQQINDLADVVIGNAGVLGLNAAADEVLGSLAGGGRVTNNVNLTVGGNNATTTYNGIIVGTGTLRKSGTGTFTLNGNTAHGPIAVSGGTLLANGVHLPGNVLVDPGATLGGTGTIAHLSGSGNLRPGTSPGVLTCSNATLGATYFVEIAGPEAGSGYDQLNARGLVNLNSATLNVALNYAPAEGERFTIVSNDLVEATSGNFAGLGNGGVITVNSVQFRVHYNVGNNDVQLICTNTPFRMPTLIVDGADADVFLDFNECMALQAVLTNVLATPVTGVSARLETRTSGVAVTQPLANFGTIPVGGRVTNAIPFQITTLPNFPCGADAELALILETTSHGTTRIPVTIGSGNIGPDVRFDNSAATPIPDLGTANSTINVSGIASPIRRVVVSMHITHTAADDLDIELISPGGIPVLLSSDNGATASDYGTSCADGQRTVFSNSAATSIAAASAPFVGTFRPEGGLAAFNDLSGTEANGTWTLRVTDDAGGAVGTLRCWSLMIASAVCDDVGGACELCPERTVFGSIGTNSTIQSGRLVFNSVASECGTNKACPGISAGGARYYDAFTFVNGESNACIEVTLQADCALFSAAYLNSYDPSNLCANYLADAGRNTASGGTNYSFEVPAGARFVVVVHQFNTLNECDYRLDVRGGSCRPELNITSLDANRVLLDWTTAAAGYQLQRAGAASTPIWIPVSTDPAIINSRYHVTNTVTGDLRRFFRLRSP